MQAFDEDIARCLEVLASGGLILYPTDTVWGIGCDATNEKSIQKIFELKQRAENKSMIVLMSSEKEVLQWVAAVDLLVFDFIQSQERPTTVVFDGALGLPQNLVDADGSIGIRLVRDEFCRHLIKRFRKPIVSTSANQSGMTAAATFPSISPVIKEGVDYVAQWRRNDNTESLPSQVIRWKEGKPEWLRK